MAKLNIIKELKIKNLNLELSLPEVKALSLVFSSVGGSTTKSARKYIDNIATELYNIIQLSQEEMNMVKGTIDLPDITLKFVNNNENIHI